MNEFYFEGEIVERFKSEKVYPRVFATLIAVITSIIIAFMIYVIANEFHTILPLTRNGYIYITERIVIFVSLIELVVYLMAFYGREKNNLYNISLVLFIIYLAIPVVNELMNTSFQVMPSKLSMAKILFRIVMIVAEILLLIENRRKRDGKKQIILFGTMFTVMYLGFVISTSVWITGGFDDMSYLWITIKQELIDNIAYIPFILVAFFCSKNYSILAKAKENNIELEKPLYKKIKDRHLQNR